MRESRESPVFRVSLVFLAALVLMAKMAMLVHQVRMDLSASVVSQESSAVLVSAVHLEPLALLALLV